MSYSQPTQCGAATLYDAESISTNLSRPSHWRVRTYWAQSLILFNVYGIPLSSGIWLEYTFTNLLPQKSLTAISLIYALHLSLLFASILPSRWFYTRFPRHHSALLLFATLLASIATAIPITLPTYPSLAACLALQGIALGTIATLHTLRLSSHYRAYTALAASLAPSIGFLGAALHSTTTHICLRTYHPGAAHAVSLALLLGTTLPAVAISKTCPAASRRPPLSPPSLHCRPYLAAALATLPAFILAPLLYTPLLLSRSLHPDVSATAHIVSLAAAALAAPLAAQHSLNRAGRPASTTLLGFGVVLAGAGVLVPCFSTGWAAGLMGGVLFGAACGAIAVVYAGVVAGLGKGWAEGIVGFCGLVVAGVVVGFAGVAEEKGGARGVVVGCFGTLVGLGVLMLGAGVGWGKRRGGDGVRIG